MAIAVGRGVAVVTGAARGFGLEIARRLVARGHTVLITDLDAGAVQRASESSAPRARPRSRRRRRRRAAGDGAAAPELGPLKVWVNNAGIAKAKRPGSTPTRTSTRWSASTCAG